ncbi:hypothetical protein C8Q80DRAFT_608626 [Daedaleopsis nitida]|nr:hypothetical protein C8Q80DRAFT_608626 [Daedaleopsis nitida]
MPGLRRCPAKNVRTDRERALESTRFSSTRSKTTLTCTWICRVKATSSSTTRTGRQQRSPCAHAEFRAGDRTETATEESERTQMHHLRVATRVVKFDPAARRRLLPTHRRRTPHGDPGLRTRLRIRMRTPISRRIPARKAESHIHIRIDIDTRRTLVRGRNRLAGGPSPLREVGRGRGRREAPGARRPSRPPSTASQVLASAFPHLPVAPTEPERPVG